MSLGRIEKVKRKNWISSSSTSSTFNGHIRGDGDDDHNGRI